MSWHQLRLSVRPTCNRGRGEVENKGTGGKGRGENKGNAGRMATESEGRKGNLTVFESRRLAYVACIIAKHLVMQHIRYEYATFLKKGGLTIGTPEHVAVGR